MNQAITLTTDRSGLINRIADVTMRLLIDRHIVDDATKPSPVFFAWPRGNRLVMVLDPLQVRNPDAIDRKSTRLNSSH